LLSDAVHFVLVCVGE